MVEVRVPASSANMGPGFDSFGIALSLYNTIRVSETDGGLNIIDSGNDEYIPHDKNNLIYKSVIRAFDEVGYSVRGLQISQNSFIPMTRGLGSSSSCIVGGLIAGNIISGRKLTTQRIFELADEIEGHPDNVAPALFGGFCISCRDGGKLYRKTIRPDGKIKFVAMIPNYFVATKKSRTLLPKAVVTEDAVYNISHASMLAAAFAAGDYANLDIFTSDRLHQPYREPIIDHMEEIFKASSDLGAYAAYLSGSGPTIVALVSAEDSEFNDKMQAWLNLRGIDRKCTELTVDNVGAIAVEHGGKRRIFE